MQGITIKRHLSGKIWKLMDWDDLILKEWSMGVRITYGKRRVRWGIWLEPGLSPSRVYMKICSFYLSLFPVMQNLRKNPFWSLPLSQQRLIKSNSIPHCSCFRSVPVTFALRELLKFPLFVCWYNWTSRLPAQFKKKKKPKGTLILGWWKLRLNFQRRMSHIF